MTPENLAMHIAYDSEWVDQALCDMRSAILELWQHAINDEDLSTETIRLAEELTKNQCQS
jgi:hypothetical protein